VLQKQISFDIQSGLHDSLYVFRFFCHLVYLLIMEVTTMFSEKGKMLLVVNQFKFSQAHIAKDGKIRWRCVKRDCSAKVYTQVSDKTNSVECGDIFSS
jgi:hypothetical protein